MNKPLIICCLLAVSPIVVHAQTCKPASIPATTPTSQFTDHADGTVTDTKTGLMWKKCAEGQDPLTCSGSATSFNWQAALQRAQDVNGGMTGNNLNYTDWRVPNIKELVSLVEEKCYDPAINIAVFPNTPYAQFWSMSPYANYGFGAWRVNFRYGNDQGSLKSFGQSVRLVRSGSDGSSGIFE